MDRQALIELLAKQFEDASSTWSCPAEVGLPARGTGCAHFKDCAHCWAEAIYDSVVEVEGPHEPA